MPKENYITIELRCEDKSIDVDFDKLKSLAENICRRFQVSSASVGISIVNDEDMKTVNTDFLDATYTTDVISFDLSDDDTVRVFDLVINSDEAKRQSQKRNHSLDAELALYITHGLLHNLGFDDCDIEQSQKMHSMEDDILQEAGFGIVYGE